MYFSKSKRLEVKILKEEKLTAVLVNVETGMFGIIEVANELETFYKVLGCRRIDITIRRIGDRVAEIICDDEGLLVDSPKISAIDNLGQAQLAGNLLIVGRCDSEGNLTSLSADDAAYIFGKIQLLATRKIRNPYPILTQCEYA